MIKVNCPECGNDNFKPPSRINRRNFCNAVCYKKTRSKELSESGKEYRFKKGEARPKWVYEKISQVLKNDGHPKWKGEKVSYRGLHMWIMRNKGKPDTCKHCGVYDRRPRYIQWANIDGKYKRDLGDFIPLCVACHKKYDFNLKSTLDVRSATR